MTTLGQHGAPVVAPAAFSPALRVRDPYGSYWVRQATLRLRREICWMWFQRAEREASAMGANGGRLPPEADRLSTSLDLARYDGDRREFFAADETAAYLTRELSAAPPPLSAGARGGFGWVAEILDLAPADRFVLALALLPTIDAAAGPVLAATLDAPGRTEPSLALAQRLWDDPAELLRLFDPAHGLVRSGVLAPVTAWDAPLVVHGLVALRLLGHDTRAAGGMEPVPPSNTRAGCAATHRAPARHSGLRLVPVIGPAGAPISAAASAHAGAVGRWLLAASPRLEVSTAATLAWLDDSDLLLPSERIVPRDGPAGGPQPALPDVPVTVYVTLHDRALLRALPFPASAPISVAGLGYSERLALWRERLRDVPAEGDLDAAIVECARRFRCEQGRVEEICAELRSRSGSIRPTDVFDACRADLNLGSLAQEVHPRFTLDELMLPRAQAEQVSELVCAMTNLTRVHYEWGTARAWNEGGLSALFAGPPGTGKTMAAEAIAAELALPMFRIDLSQVVNKYIGETEKNLRTLFDAAEAADVILFFDEADALFGRRTEVRDAHDRYANLEVSYLLERMERFKGLAILATNRRKDLDVAFMRRLRFVIEFPMPGVAERLRIWRSILPDGVDASGLDLEFLASRFPLAGGHLRAVVFQACLQSAGAGSPRRLEMASVVRALRREYDKLDRAVSLDQFGRYAPLVAAGGAA